jgi:putative peptidoglycan binding protein
MKRTMYLVCIGSLALALTAAAAQDNKRKSEKARPQHRTATVQTARPANTARSMAAHRNVSAAQSQQRSYAKPRTSSAVNRKRVAATPSSQRIGGGSGATRATVHQRNVARNESMGQRNSQEFRARRDVAAKTPTARPASATARDRNLAVNRMRNDINRNRNRNESSARNNVAVNRERNLAVNRTRNADVNRFRNANDFRGRNDVAINRNRNFNRTQNAAFYRGGNVRVTNNWRGDAFRGQRYWAFRNYNRQWHDHSWWRSHYTRIIFVNSGWWYWNAGYWFPAWGYAPYVSYVYDGPIYAYNGLTPDQVTVNVQEQLAAAGYYDGPIDGILGPMTREAIAAYQADNGLAVTSAIDEPTLATMGLV